MNAVAASQPIPADASAEERTGDAPSCLHPPSSFRHTPPEDDPPAASAAPHPTHPTRPPRGSNGVTSAKPPGKSGPKCPELPASGARVTLYGYRYYDPVTGRWPSRDPIEEAGGINLYGFVGNNGVNELDYLGLELFTFNETFYDNSFAPLFLIPIGGATLDVDVDCEKCEIKSAEIGTYGLNISGSLGPIDAGIGWTPSIIARDASRVSCDMDECPGSSCKFEIKVRYRRTIIVGLDSYVKTYSGECPCELTSGTM